MKVLQINTVYKNGGSTGRIVYDLKNISEQYNINAYVAFGYEYALTHDEHTFKMGNIPERKWNILKTRLFGRHGFYNKCATRRLLKYMNEVKPDIIHLHNIHNHYVNVQMLFEYIKQYDIPVIWTLHDCWPFTGWCAYFDYAQCDKWKTGCNHCSSLQDYPITWFLDKSKENYEKKKEIFTGVKNLTIVTPSQWLANLVKESFLKEYPVNVINNGIDINIFHHTQNDVKKQLGIEGKKMILAMAGVFSKRKGIDDLLQLPHYLSDNEVLVLVGLKPKQKKILPNRRCIGILRTNNIQELAAYYSTADIFINPTLEDNFPTTNIEALACGTPIVTYCTGGSIESVDETTGLVVPKGDIKGLIDAIRIITSQTKDTFKSACENKARENYEKKKQYLKYIELYKKIQIR